MMAHSALPRHRSARVVFLKLRLSYVSGDTSLALCDGTPELGYIDHSSCATKTLLPEFQVDFRTNSSLVPLAHLSGAQKVSRITRVAGFPFKKRQISWWKTHRNRPLVGAAYPKTGDVAKHSDTWEVASEFLACGLTDFVLFCVCVCVCFV